MIEVNDWIGREIAGGRYMVKDAPRCREYGAGVPRPR